MKKIWILGVFWLLWQISFAADPQLVEARSWTNRSKSTSSSTYCDGSGKCSTSTTVTEHKNNQPRYNYNNYGYGYGYAPSGPTWTWDLRCLFGCTHERVIVVQQPPPQIVIVERPAIQQYVYEDKSGAKVSVINIAPEAPRQLPDVSLGRLANVRHYLDIVQASPRERIALERVILEISDRKNAEFSEDVLRGELVYLDRLLRKLKRANVKEDKIGALEDALDYIETAVSK